MKRSTLAIALITILSAGSVCLAQPADKILTESCPAKLIIPREDIPKLREKVKSGPPKVWWEATVAWADKFDVEKWNAASAKASSPSDFSGHMNMDIPAMGFTYLVSGQDKYAEKCKQMMLKLAQTESNHSQGAGLFEWRDWKGGGVGLEVVPFCIGYDCIYSYLGEKERADFREIIAKRGAYPLYGFLLHEVKNKLGPDAVDNQYYNAITGMLFCALTLRGHNSDADAWLEMAIRVTGYACTSVADDGSINDEIGYMFSWMMNLPMLLDALDRCAGIDMWSQGGFRNSFKFLMAQALPSDFFDPTKPYDISRGGAKVPMSYWEWAMSPPITTCDFYPSALLVFANKFKDPSYMWIWRRISLDKDGKPVGGGGFWSIIRYDPALAQQTGAAPTLPLAAKFPKNNGIFLRTGQRADDVMLTAGMDSLDIFGYGQNWLITVGGRTDYRSADHNMFAWGHNTVFIGDNPSTYVRPIREFWHGPSADYFRLGIAEGRPDDGRDIPGVLNKYADVKRNDREVLFMRPVQGQSTPPYVLVIDTVEKANRPAFMTEQFGTQASDQPYTAQSNSNPPLTTMDIDAAKRVAVMHRNGMDLDFHCLLPEQATIDSEIGYRMYYWGMDRRILRITAGKMLPPTSQKNVMPAMNVAELAGKGAAGGWTLAVKRAKQASPITPRAATGPKNAPALQFAGLTKDDSVHMVSPSCPVEGQKSYRISMPYRWKSQQPANGVALTVSLRQMDDKGQPTAGAPFWGGSQTIFVASMDGWRLADPYRWPGGFKLPIKADALLTEKKLPDLGDGWFLFEREIIARANTAQIALDVDLGDKDTVFYQSKRIMETRPDGELELGLVEVVELESRPKVMNARFATLIYPVRQGQARPEVKQQNLADGLVVTVAGGASADTILYGFNTGLVQGSGAAMQGSAGFIRGGSFGGQQLTQLKAKDATLVQASKPVDIDISGDRGTVRCSAPTTLNLQAGPAISLPQAGYYTLQRAGGTWTATAAKEPW